MDADAIHMLRETRVFGPHLCAGDGRILVSDWDIGQKKEKNVVGTRDQRQRRGLHVVALVYVIVTVLLAKASCPNCVNGLRYGRHRELQ